MVAPVLQTERQPRPLTENRISWSRGPPWECGQSYQPTLLTLEKFRETSTGSPCSGECRTDPVRLSEYNGRMATMRRREFLAQSAALSAAQPSPPAARRPRNVLLLIADDLG